MVIYQQNLKCNYNSSIFIRDDLLNSHWDIPPFVLKHSLNLSVTAKNVTSSKAREKIIFSGLIALIENSNLIGSWTNDKYEFYKSTYLA